MNDSNPVQWARRCASVALSLTTLVCLLAAGSVIVAEREKDTGKPSPFTLDWANNFLKIHGGKLAAIRRSVVRGAPYGEETWQQQTATALGLESALRRPGRPRKQKEPGKT